MNMIAAHYICEDGALTTEHCQPIYMQVIHLLFSSNHPNNLPFLPNTLYSTPQRKTPGSPDTQPNHAVSCEFINTLSSLHPNLHFARLSNNPIALLSWRRSTRRLVGLLTPHLRVVRVLRLLELNSALLRAIVIRIPPSILSSAILLLLRRAVRRRRCRSTTVVVPALLSLVVVVLELLLLVATVLAGKPARAVAWGEATTAAAAGVDASGER